MADYIKRDDALKVLCEFCVMNCGVDEEKCFQYDCMKNNIPAADVVEVVRCKDCKHRVLNKHYGEILYMNLKAVCDLDTGDPYQLARNAEDDDWFCADGERRTEDG